MVRNAVGTTQERACGLTIAVCDGQERRLERAFRWWTNGEVTLPHRCRSVGNADYFSQ